MINGLSYENIVGIVFVLQSLFCHTIFFTKVKKTLVQIQQNGQYKSVMRIEILTIVGLLLHYLLTFA